MMPPPPGLLSSTMVWPSVSVIDLPTARDRMSVLPPGADITIMRIGLVGYGCASAQCAQAATPMVITPAAGLSFSAMANSGLQQRTQLARVGELLDVPHGVAQFSRAGFAEHRLRVQAQFAAVAQFQFDDALAAGHHARQFVVAVEFDAASEVEHFLVA